MKNNILQYGSGYLSDRSLNNNKYNKLTAPFSPNLNFQFKSEFRIQSRVAKLICVSFSCLYVFYSSAI